MLCLPAHAFILIFEQSVEMISSDIQVTDSPPYYHVTTHNTHTRYDDGKVTKETSYGDGGAGWALAWRTAIQNNPECPVPLPLPSVKQYYAKVKDLLRVPIKQPSVLYR